MKVLIVVTHLLGSGHLSRALILARAFAKAGHDPVILSGGVPVAVLASHDIPMIQLPPLRSDGVDFSTLLTADGTAATPEYLAERQRQILSALSDLAPDILITELFPFGRRSLRTEFEALLTAAKLTVSRPLVCASIRDILAPPSKPTKVDYADTLIDRFYNAVLVHSDAAVMPLEVSWPVSPALRSKLHYTGFVAAAASGPHADKAGHGEIIISAGGGDVGAPVYAAAIEAARLVQRPMRLLVGGSGADRRIASLAARAPSHVTVEFARPDFRHMLHHATASVSLCGYNTALDILQAGTPAVFIPFDDGNEVEQGLRAQSLSTESGMTTLKRADLTGARLNMALDYVIAAPPRPRDTADFDGASRTVELAERLRRTQ